MTVVLVTGCSTTRNHVASVISNKVIAGTPSPGWVWVPEYFIYDGNRYRFVRGHYRKVLSRKFYWRRMLRGYSSRNNYTSAR